SVRGPPERALTDELRAARDGGRHGDAAAPERADPERVVVRPPRARRAAAAGAARRPRRAREGRHVVSDAVHVAFDLGAESGRALIANPLSYRDGRGAALMREALSRVPAEEIYAITGIQFLPINTLFQLLALETTATLDQAATLLLIPDLLAYWLTGERHAEA